MRYRFHLQRSYWRQKQSACGSPADLQRLFGTVPYNNKRLARFYTFLEGKMCQGKRRVKTGLSHYTRR